jgi:hypothetical protein
VSIVAAIKAIIAADAACIVALGGRIFADALPEDSALPAATIEVVTNAPIHGIRQDTIWHMARLQIDAWAATVDARNSTAEAIKAALGRYTGTIAGIVIDDCMLDNESTAYSFSLDMRRATLDFITYYSE